MSVMTDEKFTPPIGPCKWLAVWNGKLYDWVRMPTQRSCTVTAQTYFQAVQIATTILHVPAEFIEARPKEETEPKMVGKRATKKSP